MTASFWSLTTPASEPEVWAIKLMENSKLKSVIVIIDFKGFIIAPLLTAVGVGLASR